MLKPKKYAKYNTIISLPAISVASQVGEYDILVSIMQEFIAKIKFERKWIFPVFFGLIIILWGLICIKAFDIPYFLDDKEAPWAKMPSPLSP